MTLSNFLRSLARRWYLLLGALVLTASLCFAAYSAVPPSYERAASVLLMPGTQTIPAGGNPYLYLGGLGQASEILVAAMNSNSMRQDLLLGHSRTEISVARDPASSGPLVAVSVSGPSDAAVTAVLDRTLTAISDTLTALQNQADVPATAQIDALQLTAEPTSVLVVKDQFQLVALVAAGGIALSLLGVGFVDGLLLSRQRGLPASFRE
ncbi:hypothetical protein [Cryobacterium luteum]|uniref:Capsular polysaccharide biosynthesis protein n=1 Tax=Cryobacterium luteum TaxID=1424661 RepID=A0A1H8CEB2_9MICO|nr:hypothetical protein [Cryobacterium luteum]TFB89347.1 hypothetical protein E3O10_10835 [Cryobacterium luteum]SEM93413.1 hypothetical protein SAMN05216281_102362 [Cryobacterium luteum]